MKKSFLFILLAIMFLLTNCATFKSGMTGKYDKTAEKNYRAEPVSLLMIFSHYRQTTGLDAIPKLDDQRQRIRGFDDFLVDALNELGNIKRYSTFTEYASDVNDPERRAQKDSLMRQHNYIMKLKFMRKKSFTKNFLGTLISSASLTLFPIAYTYNYSLEVELYDLKGQLLKTYTRKASLTKWVQTLLIVVYPFHPEQRKKEELYVEFLHDVFKQIEQEKVLKKL